MPPVPTMQYIRFLFPVANILLSASNLEAPNHGHPPTKCVYLFLSSTYLFVLDMELPDISGMDIIVRIREKDPRARIIVNTMHEEIWFIKDLIQSAVDGILFKSIDSTKIAEAIRRVLDGGSYYCPYAEHVRAQMRRSDEGRREELTLRELDVLKRISEGKNTQEIAQELCVSTNTVDTHRRHLMDKLDARNVADLIMTAISKGIIPIRKC